MSLGDSGETLNLEELMQLGIRTAKQGNKDGARVMFEKVLAADKRHERAWMWLASIAENDVDRRRYLETVLRLNPNNASAKKFLQSMDRTVASGERRSMVVGGIIIGVLIITFLLVGAIILLITR